MTVNNKLVFFLGFFAAIVFLAIVLFFKYAGFPSFQPSSIEKITFNGSMFYYSSNTRIYDEVIDDPKIIDLIVNILNSNLHHRMVFFSFLERIDRLPYLSGTRMDIAIHMKDGNVVSLYVKSQIYSHSIIVFSGSDVYLSMAAIDVYLDKELEATGYGRSQE